MRNRSAIASAAVLCAGGLLVAGCGSGGSTTSNAGGYPAGSSSAAQSTPTSAAPAAATTAGASASAGGETIVSTVHTGLGTILAAGPKHLTVYLFEADRTSTSNCSGPCAQAWPPVTTTGSPQAQGGALAADLGTTTRADGTKQLTYRGHPSTTTSAIRAAATPPARVSTALARRGTSSTSRARLSDNF